MSSTIRGSDNFDSKDIVVGTAKAWVNFNGTGTVAIRDSFNVSSITDNATGDYTINFTNNMPNANYAESVELSISGLFSLPLGSVYAKLVSSYRFSYESWDGNNANNATPGDANNINVVIFAN